MLALPPFVLRVTLPMIAPILASVGNLVVVSPSHPTHTLAVTDATGRRVRRYRHVPDADLFEPLVTLTSSGVLVFVRPADQRLLHRLRPTG